MCEAGQGGSFRDLSWHRGGNGLVAMWKGSRFAWCPALPCGWSGGDRGAVDLKTEFQSFDEGNVSFAWSS